jgi:hypothetical protein
MKRDKRVACGWTSFHQLLLRRPAEVAVYLLPI